jgi:phosphatidylglycerophosphate synthase
MTDRGKSYTTAEAIRVYATKRVLDKENSNYWLFRGLSFRVAPIFLRLGCTPDGVTLLSLVVGFVYVLLFASPDPGLQTVGYGVCFLAALLDYVDGNMARMLGRPNHFGKFIDGMFGITHESLKYIALGVAVGRGGVAHLQLSPVVWCAIGALGTYGFLLGGMASYRARFARMELQQQKRQEADGIIVRPSDFRATPYAVLPFLRHWRVVAAGRVIDRTWYIVSRVLKEVEYPLLLPAIWWDLGLWVVLFAGLNLVGGVYSLAKATVQSYVDLNYWRPT